MAKLTKKEIKEMEEMKRAKRSLRREMMDSLQNYWKDVEAMERVYKKSFNIFIKGTRNSSFFMSK